MDESAVFLSPLSGSSTLARCESTPIQGSLPDKQCYFGSPSSDSGIDMTSSVITDDKSDYSFASTTSSGAVPKRMTRSRARQLSSSSCSKTNSSDAGGTPTLERDLYSLRSHCLIKSAKNITRNSPRIVYSPGAFAWRDQMDMVRRLNEMGIYHILSIIWSYLSAEDIGRALQVSATWNTALLMDKDAMVRWSEAKDKVTENTLPDQEKARLLKTSPRKALSSVSNLLMSPVKPSTSTTDQRRSARLTRANKRGNDELPPPILVSPSKFRHKLFTEEASRLAPDEQLQPCPRCTSPSRVVPSEFKASCSRISCQFAFCTRCMCEFHKDSSCRTTKGGKSKACVGSLSPSSSSSSGSSTTHSKASVASKKSRNRLKRL